MFSTNSSLAGTTRIYKTAKQTAKLLAVSLLPAVLTCAQASAPVAAAYYQESDSFPLSKLIANGSVAKLTHLNYAFANIAYDSKSQTPYTCGLHDPSGELGPNGVMKQLAALKQANPALKILISIGGQTGSYDFKSIAGLGGAASAANRTGFVQSCITQFIGGGFASPAQPGIFDGIDLDWEFPSESDDVNNYNLLLKEFRSQLDTYKQQHSLVQSKLLLTSAVILENSPGGLQNISFSGSTGAANYVDFFNLMAYDYAGTWNETATSTAPLSRIMSDASSLMSQGVPANKMVLGIPFYGIHYTGSYANDTVNTDLNTLLSHTSKNPVLIPNDPDGGTQATDYSAILKNTLLNSNGDANTSVRVQHDSDSSAWAFDSANKLLWVYDDETTIYSKAAYARSSGFLGLMTWDISKDSDAGTLLCALESGANGSNTSVCGSGTSNNPSNSGILLYDFESDSQGWTRTGGVFSLRNSTDKANTGNASLAVNFISYRQTYQPHGTVYVIPSTAVRAGSTVEFRIWIPSAAFNSLTAITPFFMDANWQWTSTATNLWSLTPDAWNTLSVKVPANAVAPFTEIGIQFDLYRLWTGTVYIDSVTVK